MSGNKNSRKKRFGNVRKLPSGRWQARYTGPDGLPRNAPDTFETKTDAEQWLVTTEADMLRGTWLDPEAGKIEFKDYSAKWVDERGLKKRSREEYERNLRLHINPFVGHLPMSGITTQTIRTWRSGRQKAKVGSSTIAKCYRIMHAIFVTAVEDDEMIRRNPCRIKGAGQDIADERPIATLDQVFAIAEKIRPRYRLLVLLATFAQLRFGELVGLRRRNIDLDAMELRVRKATAELEDGTQEDGDPKSKAGKRPISLPHGLHEDIKLHLDRYAQAGQDGRLFIGEQGGIPRRRNFNRVWKRALQRAGIPAEMDLHLHDLRHTGSTWSSRGGASLKELMARIGHSSTRAALIYQHADRERDQAIASVLDELIMEARGKMQS